MDIAKKKGGKLQVEDALLFRKVKVSRAKSLIGAGCYFSKVTSYYMCKIQYLTREKPLLNLNLYLFKLVIVRKFSNFQYSKLNGYSQGFKLNFLDLSGFGKCK